MVKVLYKGDVCYQAVSEGVSSVGALFLVFSVSDTNRMTMAAGKVRLDAPLFKSLPSVRQGMGT